MPNVNTQRAFVQDKVRSPRYICETQHGNRTRVLRLVFTRLFVALHGAIALISGKQMSCMDQ